MWLKTFNFLVFILDLLLVSAGSSAYILHVCRQFLHPRFIFYFARRDKALLIELAFAIQVFCLLRLFDKYLDLLKWKNVGISPQCGLHRWRRLGRAEELFSVLIRWKWIFRFFGSLDILWTVQEANFQSFTTRIDLFFVFQEQQFHKGLVVLAQCKAREFYFWDRLLGHGFKRIVFFQQFNVATFSERGQCLAK